MYLVHHMQDLRDKEIPVLNMSYGDGGTPRKRFFFDVDVPMIHHRNGINLRYLGKTFTLLRTEKRTFIKENLRMDDLKFYDLQQAYIFFLSLH